MTEKRTADEDLAKEASQWISRQMTPAGWDDAPEAVPRAKESIQINIRLPRPMVEILKEFARRSGIGYQVLMKRWLDERIRVERDRLRLDQERLRRERERVLGPPTILLTSPTFYSQAVAFDASCVSNLPSGNSVPGPATGEGHVT